jgi:hypothetical protein
VKTKNLGPAVAVRLHAAEGLIAAALDALPVERFVLDGEFVVLDDDGRSNSVKLAHGRTPGRTPMASICCSEMPTKDGNRIEDRRAALAGRYATASQFVTGDYIMGARCAFFEAVRQAAGCETAEFAMRRKARR